MDTVGFPNTRPDPGFTLIEVLVSLLLVSISTLGAASLLSVGTRFDRDSFNHTQAVVLASDIASRIRSNRTVAEKGLYTQKGKAVAGSVVCGGSVKPCSAEALASHDLEYWHKSIKSMLPDGRGTISLSRSSHVHTFSVRISWGKDPLPRSVKERCKHWSGCLELEVGI